MKWIYEECKKESINYKTRNEFKEKNKSCFLFIIKNKWYDLFKHMIPLKKYWTYEECKEESLKYKTRNEFRISNRKCYSYINKYKWFWLFSNMIKLKENWTYEECKKESLKYKTRNEFRIFNNKCYNKCIRSKWSVELFKHMDYLTKPNNYWSYEECKKEALLYNSRSEFSKFRSQAYQVSLKNDWLDEICQHMQTFGNLKKRCIYVYEFENNYAYVGLTHDFEGRWKKRLEDKNDIVTIFIKENGILPKRIKLTDYILDKEASVLEKFYLNLYKENRWNLLNRNKAGSLGGNIPIWTYERCLDESKKYNSLFEFRKNNYLCVSAIYKNKWNHLFDHMEKKNKKLTYDQCLEKIKLCSNKKEFLEKYRNLYMASIRNKWLGKLYDIVNF